MKPVLSGVLAEIAAEVGEAAAVQIAARVGGTRIYIPAELEEGHWLIECVGHATAAKICALFAVDGRGTRLDVPAGCSSPYKGLQRSIARRVLELDQAGKSSRVIAQTTGISQRSVHRYRALIRERGGRV